jgi:hypothetical protein
LRRINGEVVLKHLNLKPAGNFVAGVPGGRGGGEGGLSFVYVQILKDDIFDYFHGFFVQQILMFSQFSMVPVLELLLKLKEYILFI